MGGLKHPGSYGGTRKDHVLSEHRSRAEKMESQFGWLCDGEHHRPIANVLRRVS